MNSFIIELNQARGNLYGQIYEYIKKEIREGKLTYQEKLPSTRSLAEFLQVSRSTVDMAYAQLLSEGYIESRPYRGYFVCKVEELYRITADNSEIRTNEESEPERYEIDFSPNAVEAEAFPFDTWRKLNRAVLQDANRELFNPGPAMGEWELRRSISRYLHASRGVACRPEQIVIGAGNDYLLMLLRMLLGEGRCVAMENPTYQSAWRMFDSFGYRIRTVSMDSYGMKVEELEESGAELAYVMPSHQFPTGIVMPIGRRMELLKWAAQMPDRYLIEDDYDSEFRYKGRPVPALQASDKCGRVIYLGTFSKSIAPSIRISYLVLPELLLEAFRVRGAFLSCTVPRLDQAVLHVFIRDGYYERHLNKMRKIYREKHDLMLQQLKAFQKRFTIHGENAGLHLLLEAGAQESESEFRLRERAKQAGVRVYGMQEASGVARDISYHKKPAIILGYGGLSKQQIVTGIKRLESAWLHGIQ